jgi:hypothetical protein
MLSVFTVEAAVLEGLAAVEADMATSEVQADPDKMEEAINRLAQLQEDAQRLKVRNCRPLLVAVALCMQCCNKLQFECCEWCKCLTVCVSAVAVLLPKRRQTQCCNYMYLQHICVPACLLVRCVRSSFSAVIISAVCCPGCLKMCFTVL